MRNLQLAVLLILICSACCANYFFGDVTPEGKLVHREKVVYAAFPWMKRVKQYSYKDPWGRQIKAIKCYDYQRTEAEVKIVSGGLNYSFVDFELTSQSSYGLEYAIEIYV